MSDIKKKFRDIFGSEISEEDNSNEKVQAETIADSTDENTVDNVNEDTVADETEDAPCDGENTSGEAFEDAVAEDDVQIYGNADETADDSAEIEHDAKNYFNSTYQDSIEERIKSIRENALNTYAKDESLMSRQKSLFMKMVFRITHLKTLKTDMLKVKEFIRMMKLLMMHLYMIRKTYMITAKRL